MKRRNPIFTISLLMLVMAVCLAVPAHAEKETPDPDGAGNPPYGVSLVDTDNGQCLFVTEQEPGAKPVLVAILHPDDWACDVLPDSPFSYDLDTGLLSRRTSADPLEYEPIMYVVDGVAISLRDMAARKSLTPEYDISIGTELDSKGKKICVRHVWYDGIEYREKDGLTLDGLRSVQEARRLTPGYKRLFPEGWSYEIRKAEKAAISVDTKNGAVVFSVKESLDEFPRESLVRILKHLDGLRGAVPDEAPANPG